MKFQFKVFLFQTKNMTKFYKISSSQTNLNSIEPSQRINIEEKKKSTQEKMSSFWRDPNAIIQTQNIPEPAPKPKPKPEIKPVVVQSEVKQSEHVVPIKELKEREVVVYDDVQSKWKIITVYDI